MAEDLRIKLSASIDTKDVEKAASELPGRIDREQRRRRGSFGDFTRGYSSPDPATGQMRRTVPTPRFEGPGSPEAIQAASEAARQRKSEEERKRKEEAERQRLEQESSDAVLRIRMREYEAKKKEEERRLAEAARAAEQQKREQDRLAREAQRQAERQAREAQRLADQQAREQARLAREAARLAQQQADAAQRAAAQAARQQAQQQAQQQRAAAQAAAAAQRAADQQARDEQRRSDEILRTRMRLFREQQRQEREAQRQAEAKDWSKRFADQVGAGLMRTIGPWAIALKAFDYVVDKIKDKFNQLSGLYTAQQIIGFDAVKMQRMAFAFGQAGMKEEQVTDALSSGQLKLQRGLMGMDQGAIMAITQLGFSMEDVRSGAVDIIDVMMRLSDKLKENGQDARLVTIGMALFGNQFEAMLPLLQNGSNAIARLGDKAPVISQTSLQLARDLENLKKRIDNAIGTGTVGALLAGPEREAAFDLALKMGSILDASANAQEALKTAFKIKSEGGLRDEAESIDSFSRRLRESLQLASVNPQRVIGPAGPGGMPTIRTLQPSVQKFLPEYEATVGGIMSLLQPKRFMTGGGSLPMASSLQQMGGGDIYSAINRGPVDRIADASEQTAQNTAAIANRQASPTNTPAPAIVGP